MLPAQESIPSTKEKLQNALKARNIQEINGDPVPENPDDIEFGVPVDRNDLEKGWVRLELHIAEGSDSSSKKGPLTDSLQAADIRDGQPIAFRFKKASAEEDKDDELDVEFEDPGWDVVVPSLDDEEAE